MNIIYRKNLAAKEDILTHFVNCESSYIEDFRKKVIINACAQKIIQYANRETAWFNNKLVGLIAYYLRDNHSLFITNICVSANFVCQGIASVLLQKCMDEGLRMV